MRTNTMKKYFYFLLLIGMIIMNTIPVCASIYDFDGTISCETLEAYLSRAIEMCGVCVSGDHIPEMYQ